MTAPSQRALDYCNQAVARRRVHGHRLPSGVPVCQLSSMQESCDTYFLYFLAYSTAG